jgi:hypothetical protein
MDTNKSSLDTGVRPTPLPLPSLPLRLLNNPFSFLNRIRPHPPTPQQHAPLPHNLLRLGPALPPHLLSLITVRLSTIAAIHAQCRSRARAVERLPRRIRGKGLRRLRGCDLGARVMGHGGRILPCGRGFVADVGYGGCGAVAASRWGWRWGAFGA